MVHLPHLRHGHGAQNQGIKELHKAPAVALLNGIQVIGEQAHEVAHLVLLVVFPAQIFGMVKHLVPQVSLHPNGRAENGHPPQEPAKHDGNRHAHHGHTDFVQQERHVKGLLHPVYHHIALVHAVDDHLIQLWNDQLQIVHCPQGKKSQQQVGGIFQVVFVDVFAEYHNCVPPCCTQKLLSLYHTHLSVATTFPFLDTNYFIFAPPKSA